MISKIYGSKEVIIKNSILDKNEENDTKNVNTFLIIIIIVQLSLINKINFVILF